MSLHRCRRSGVRYVTTCYDFRFVVNTVLPQGLDCDTIRFGVDRVVAPDDQTPFLHANACSMEHLASHPSQHFCNSNISNPYHRCIASLQSPFDRDRPLTVVGVIDIQAPVSVFQLVRRASNLGIGAVRLRRVVAVAALLATVATAWPSCMACW